MIKKGDRVKIYGTVQAGPMNSHWQAVINYCTGITIGIVEDTSWLNEIAVKVIKDSAISSRSLVGKLVLVHPKQCRKMRV